MQGEEILLEVSHVNKEFPVKKQRLHAVSDVSFALHKGEILGIVGKLSEGFVPEIYLYDENMPGNRRRERLREKYTGENAGGLTAGVIRKNGAERCGLRSTQRKRKKSIPKKDPDGLSGSFKLLFTAYEDRDISGRATKKL